MELDISWRSQSLDALSTRQLLALLKLRQDVFIVEQTCLYSDIDRYDVDALHLQGESSSGLIAYGRILRPGTRFIEPSVGRVVVRGDCRGLAIGKQLMNASLSVCREQYPGTPVRISAQVHLQSFYESLGFEVCSGIYDEDGIDHVEMLTANG